MRIIETELAGVVIIEPQVFHDNRGFFFESWNERVIQEVIEADLHFVQDNHSHSKKGVLRGLHYQIKQAQGKLVRVAFGCVYDVAVDLRKSSPGFGRWVGVELNDRNQRQLWIPPGFAHGFVVLSERADFLYKTTSYRAPEFERTIYWNDPDLAIEWPVEDIELVCSDKDRQAASFKSVEYFA